MSETVQKRPWEMDDFLCQTVRIYLYREHVSLAPRQVRVMRQYLTVWLALLGDRPDLAGMMARIPELNSREDFDFWLGTVQRDHNLSPF